MPGRLLASAASLAPSPVLLTLAPEGGWADDLGSNERAAQFYNGVTYFAFIDGTTGDVRVGAFTHATQTTFTTVVKSAWTTDPSHGSPCVLVRNSDKRLIVLYTKQADPNLYIRISTNPEDISSWGAEVNIDPQLGALEYTYPHLLQLLDEANDPIYIFIETFVDATTQKWGYSKSTDGGATWSAVVDFFQEPTAYGYLTVNKTSESRIDVLATDGPHSGTPPASIYHCYFQGGNFYRTGGEQIVVGLPFPTANMTRVWDATADSATTSPRHIMLGADGYPRALFRAYYGTTDHRWRWGRWNGSSWQTYQVCDAGWDADDGRNTVAGGACLDPNNANVVFVSRNVSGVNQMFRYYTPDDGASWIISRVTNTDTGNVRPIPVSGGVNPRVLWLNGDSDPDPFFACGVRAL